MNINYLKPDKRYKERKIKSIIWNQTPNFKYGSFSIYKQIESITGEESFGKGKDYSERAYKFLFDYLERSVDMKVMKGIPDSKIILSPPTRKNCIDKLIRLCERAEKFYSKYPQTEVIDNWAERIRHLRQGEPLRKSEQLKYSICSSSKKRFSGKQTTLREQITHMVENSKGMLSEGYIISFLNSNLRCRECNVMGQIAWCEGISNKSVDSFRDAICVNCYRNKGILTLFEIKTRWEKMVKGKGTYAGSFVALNVLMTLQANIYLVIVSRDNGNVRIGKITESNIRANKNWLYSIQEDFGYGSPSSYVMCGKGMFKMTNKMKPLVKNLTDDFCQGIFREVLSKINI